MWAVGQSDPRLDRVLFIRNVWSPIFGGSRRPRFHSRGGLHQSHQAREGTRGDGDSQGPAVELEKAKLASRRRPINVEVDECRKFIARSEKRIIDLDKERTQDGVIDTGERAIATLGSRASFRSGCTTSKAKLAAMEEERDEAVRDAQAPGSGSQGSIHPSNANFGPSGTRRWDAGPSFVSAGCHDRGERSASPGDHIKDGRRGRVLAANDRHSMVS